MRGLSGWRVGTVGKYMLDIFFVQAEDGIQAAQESRGLGNVYKGQVRQYLISTITSAGHWVPPRTHGRNPLVHI